MKKHISVMLLVAGITSGLFAATPAEDLREGIKYHDLARTAPEGNIEKAKALLGPLQKDSAIAKAYYGSILTLEAGELARQKKGIKALTLIKEGTGLIDEAVAAAPDVIDLRFLRLINGYGLSEGSPVKRYKIMKIDIDWFNGRIAQFTKEQQGVIRLYTGLYYLKANQLDEAQAAFETCVMVSPDSAEAAEAKKQMARYAE